MTKEIKNPFDDFGISQSTEAQEIIPRDSETGTPIEDDVASLKPKKPKVEITSSISIEFLLGVTYTLALRILIFFFLENIILVEDIGLKSHIAWVIAVIIGIKCTVSLTHKFA